MNDQSLSIDDLDSICRICLMQKENMIAYSTPQIIHMIEECTSVQEPLNIKLPQQICDNCYWQLQISYQFKQQYVRSVETLCDTLVSSEKYADESDIIISIRDQLRKMSSFTKDQLIDSTKFEQQVLVVKSEFNDSDCKTENCGELSVNTVETQEDTENEIYDRFADEKNGKTMAVVNSSSDDDRPNHATLTNDSDLFQITSVTGTEQKQKSLADILINKYQIYDLKCNICDKELSTRATLLRHMETHDTNRQFKYNCDVCNKGFYNRDNLNKHVIRHEANAKYKCEICSQRFYALNVLAKHNKYKHKAKPIKCEKCSLQFYHALQLQQHEQTHEQKEYKCDVCDKVFQQQYRLRKHQISHSELRQHTCKICTKDFKRKFELMKHIKYRHEKPNKGQMCSICGKLFALGLAAHIETHNRTTTYKCEHCDRVYRTRNGLQIHVKDKHTNNSNKKRYTCEVCGQSLGSKGSLSMHMKVVHSNVRIDCSHCGKGFKTQQHLKMHVASVHMNIRPFNCTVCSKAFHRKEQLKKHMRSHTGERPYSCTICNKAFGYREVLDRHLEVHSK